MSGRKEKLKRQLEKEEEEYFNIFRRLVAGGYLQMTQGKEIRKTGKMFGAVLALTGKEPDELTNEEFETVLKQIAMEVNMEEQNETEQTD